MLIYSLLFMLTSSRLFVDYSLNKQGITLQGYFFGIQNKTFLDIGGYDPIVKSNTMNLYVKGWTGINIQASPKRFSTFAPYRPKDINLNVAIGNKNQFVTLYQMSWSGSSTTSQSSVKQLTSKAKRSIKEQISVPTFQTSAICKMYVGDRGISMMTVDVEGLGALVMKMNDWQNKKCRPDMIITQQNFLNQVSSNVTQKQILTSLGYTKIDKVVENEYYVKQQLANQFRLRKILSQLTVLRYTKITFRNMYNQIRRHFKLSKYKGGLMAQYHRETDQLFIVFSQKYQPLDLDQIAKDEVQSYTQNKERYIIVLEHEPQFSEIYIKSSQCEINTIKLPSKKQLFHIKYKSENQQKNVYILNQYEIDKSQLTIISGGKYISHYKPQKIELVLDNIISKSYLILNLVIGCIIAIICYRIYNQLRKQKQVQIQEHNDTQF